MCYVYGILLLFVIKLLKDKDLVIKVCIYINKLMVI